MPEGWLLQGVESLCPSKIRYCIVGKEICIWPHVSCFSQVLAAYLLLTLGILSSYLMVIVVRMPGHGIACKPGIVVVV